MQHRASRFALLLGTLGLCLTVFSEQALAQDTPSTAASTSPQNSSDQDGQFCKVGGTVLSKVTGEPLKKVGVELTSLSSTGQQGKTLEAITDANGQFLIEHVRPGRFNLSVSREGYLRQEYGQQEGATSGAILTLAAGEKMTDLIFRLQKTAVITGRVVDEDGEPMVRVSVEVLRRRMVDGSPKFSPMGIETTDDQGTYRIFGLPPGKYFVRVTPSGNDHTMVMVGGGDQDEEESTPPPKSEYPETYYPGTTDPARAAAIDVKAGDEIPRIDFSITPRDAAKKFRVRGHVTDTLAVPAQGFIQIMAIPRNGDDLNLSGRFMAQPNQKTGNFELDQVPPGAYIVEAMLLGTGKPHTAEQDVEVTTADVDSVSLAITAGAEIPGRVTFEGSDAGAASSGNVTVSAFPERRGAPFAGVAQATLKPDGSFVLSEVGDGRYVIRIYSKCLECYLKSASATGVDLIAQGLTISGGTGPNEIDLVYSSNTGKLTGTVTDADGLPLPGAYVTLVKDTGPREADSEPKDGTTDQYGKFEISGIPPGRYKALAWAKPDADSDSYNDPDFVKPFADKLESIEVDAGSTVTLQIKAIPTNSGDGTN
jgi:protocatechuate 3,4-dioxygenase beta subunit